MLLGHEKINFLYLPTPLERLNNLSQDLGINLYIKRDDLTPLAMGGNKLRKLEYLLADAKKQGATMLLTVGGAQTNHGRLTCAVARKYGLKAAIVCIDDYPGELSANLLLDGMMGCDVWLRKPDPTHSSLMKRLPRSRRATRRKAKRSTTSRSAVPMSWAFSATMSVHRSSPNRLTRWL